MNHWYKIEITIVYHDILSTIGLVNVPTRWAMWSMKISPKTKGKNLFVFCNSKKYFPSKSMVVEGLYTELTEPLSGGIVLRARFWSPSSWLTSFSSRLLLVEGDLGF